VALRLGPSSTLALAESEFFGSSPPLLSESGQDRQRDRLLTTETCDPGGRAASEEREDRYAAQQRHEHQHRQARLR